MRSGSYWEVGVRSMSKSPAGVGFISGEKGNCKYAAFVL